MRLLVQDHTTSVEEALRLIAPIFLLLPSAVTMMGPNPLIVQHTRLTMGEFHLLNAFYTHLNVPTIDATFEDRFKRAVSELLKLVQSGAPGSSDQLKLSFT